MRDNNIYFRGHMNPLHIQRFRHKTGNNRGGSSIHRPEHVNDSDREFVAGIHPRVYRRRSCAEQVPIQSRVIDLPRYRSTRRRGEIKPHGSQFDNARHGVAVRRFGHETGASGTRVHLSASGRCVCRFRIRICGSRCGR